MLLESDYTIAARCDRVHQQRGQIANEAKQRVPFATRGCTKPMDPISQHATIIMFYHGTRFEAVWCHRPTKLAQLQNQMNSASGERVVNNNGGCWQNIVSLLPTAHYTGMSTILPSTSVTTTSYLGLFPTLYKAVETTDTGHDQGNVPCGVHHSSSPVPCRFVHGTHLVIGSQPRQFTIYYHGITIHIDSDAFEVVGIVGG